jgi:hypothetical protein
MIKTFAPKLIQAATTTLVLSCFLWTSCGQNGGTDPNAQNQQSQLFQQQGNYNFGNNTSGYSSGYSTGASYGSCQGQQQVQTMIDACGPTLNSYASHIPGQCIQALQQMASASSTCTNLVSAVNQVMSLCTQTFQQFQNYLPQACIQAIEAL